VFYYVLAVGKVGILLYVVLIIFSEKILFIVNYVDG